ncbi:CDC45 family [Syncephalis plumigaleata]|nr:CDC45 family [Syncephalis plumigaleata]
MVYYSATQLALAYDNIKRQALNGYCTVAIFVAPDADALCACRILVNLLTNDFISHKVVPVAGYTDLEEIGQELIQEHEELKSIIMLNCGALVDLTEMFSLSEQHTIYVCDTHRPIHLRNLFGSAQVVVLDDGEAEVTLRQEQEAYEKVGFALSSSEEEEEEEEEGEEESLEHNYEDEEGEDQLVEVDSTIDNATDDEIIIQRLMTLLIMTVNTRKRSSHDYSFEMNIDDRPSRRPRLQSDEVADKKEQRLDKRSRRKQYRALMVEYYSRGSYHGNACASQMYQLANQLSRATRELLWLSIIGITSMFVHDQCERLKFESVMSTMRDEVAHFEAKEREDEIPMKRLLNETAEEAKKRIELIAAERRAIAADLNALTNAAAVPYTFRLMLYRHWSFYDALYHSRYVATSLGIWSERGRTKLLNLLAKIGLSKRQANELHSELDPTLRRKMRQHLKEVAAFYRLESLQFPSFVRVIGYNGCISASDAVYSITALLKSDRATVGRLIDVEETNHTGHERELNRLLSVHYRKAIHLDATHRGMGNYNETTEEGGEGGEAEEQRSDHNKAWLQSFWIAYDALGRAELLNMGINLAKAMRKTIVRQAVTIIEKRAVRTLNNFRFTVLRDGPDLPVFAHPLTASQLALFLLDAMRATNKKRLPFVLATFCEPQNVFLVVGLADDANIESSPIRQK